MSNIDQRLETEIEELEKSLFNDEHEVFTEEVESQTVQVATSDETDKLKEELLASQKRFNNYKASSDLTIRDLRSELAKSKVDIANLRSEIVRISKSVTKDASPVFTEEERELLGEPAINVLNKSVNSIIENKVKPLEEELDRNRKESIEREKEYAKKLALENYNKFLSSLSKKVPDYEVINTDKNFITWLDGPDKDSGMPMKYHFAEAEKTLDVFRIASYFNEYKELVKPKPVVNKELESNITPVGNGVGSEISSAEDSGDKIKITPAFIEKFYNDFARGKYKGKKGLAEADRIERLIDKAIASGSL